MTETIDDLTPREPGENDKTLAARHAEIKQRLVNDLHTWADDCDHCFEFDRILFEVGLPGRPSFHKAYAQERRLDGHQYSETPEIYGEPTADEFQEWKDNATRLFHTKADEYGIGDRIDEILEANGFPRRRPMVSVKIAIDGSFRVYQTVRVREGDDVIDGVSRVSVREMVWSAFNTVDPDRLSEDDPRVTWKARVVRG